MRGHVQAPATPPVGSYRNIPYTDLRAIFRGHKYRDQDVAEAIGINTSTFSLKMRGHSDWRWDEIAAICEMLDIPQKDIGRLFFPQIKGGKKQ